MSQSSSCPLTSFHLWRVCLRLRGITFDRDSKKTRRKNWEFPYLVNFCALDSARRGIALAMNVFNWSTNSTNSTNFMKFGRSLCVQDGKGVEPIFALKTNLLSREVHVKFNNKKLGRCGNLGIWMLDYSRALWTTSPSSACLGRDNFHKRLLLVEAAIGTVQPMALRTKWLRPWKNWPIGFFWKKTFK